jgi:hypothetical protein
MNDPSSSRRESFDSDEARRPPTFVQIRPPARPGAARLKLGIAGAALVFAAVLCWSAYRLSVEQVEPLATQTALTATETPSPRQEPADLYPEFARRATDQAMAAPAWSRESLMERVAPFDPSVSGRSMVSDAPPADTRSEEPAGSYEVTARLQKGETIGSALQKRGFTAQTVAEVVSALARHVSLKRLPIGLDMVLRIRPAEEEGAKPILQALTLQPEGRREITVERDDGGNYLVTPQDRATAR